MTPLIMRSMLAWRVGFLGEPALERAGRREPGPSDTMIPPPARSGGAASLRQAYVYLLQSARDQRFYLGWTTNVPRRLGQHAAGASPYTASRGPWRLVGYEALGSVDEARARERALKRNSRMRALFTKRLLTRRGGARRTTRRDWQVGG